MAVYLPFSHFLQLCSKYLSGSGRKDSLSFFHCQEHILQPPRPLHLTQLSSHPPAGVATAAAVQRGSYRRGRSGPELRCLEAPFSLIPKPAHASETTVPHYCSSQQNWSQEPPQRPGLLAHGQPPWPCCPLQDTVRCPGMEAQVPK